jgi:hypothetical protein
VAVKIKFWKRRWWVFVHHQGHRKVKRVGDRGTAVRVAQAVREKLIRGELNLAPPADIQTLKSYSEAWLKTVTGSLKPARRVLRKRPRDPHLADVGHTCGDVHSAPRLSRPDRSVPG